MEPSRTPHAPAMSSDRWTRLERMFSEALERGPAERDRYLVTACAGDADLLAEVRGLLAADETEGPLDQPTGVRDLLADAVFPETRALEPGTRLGPWRIEREVGRGGMGAVYLATRADGQYEGQVAVKIVRRGLDTEDVLQRFARERRVLAALAHPHVARLLDAGSTPDGVPYLVMEYVDGEPITAWADAHALDVEGRLGLFLQACEAVAYAHRSLVVHRDLKPSNILVTPGREADGGPSVKLLDFGIAKLLAGEGDEEATALTRAGSRPLTPAYAAPEQFDGRPVTTATDVYALGVLLTELLSGHRPDAARPDAATRPSAAARVPVTRRSAAGETQTVPPEDLARARATTPERLARRLRGDLDTVCLKAVHPEPARRYASVDALAEDVRRHLAGLPVQARPDTLRYRAGKFVRRHRLSVAGAVAFVLVLAAASAAVGLKGREAAQERDRAERVAALLEGAFTLQDPGASGGEPLAARAVLDRSAEQVSADTTLDPRTRGRLLLVLGRAYGNLGYNDRARALLERALAASRRARAGDDPETAGALATLGHTYYREGNYPRADSLYGESLAMYRRTVGPADERTAALLHNLANVRLATGDYAGAAPFYEEAIALLRRLHGDRHPGVAKTLASLASARSYAGDLPAADSLAERAVALYRALPDAPPMDVAFAYDLAYYMALERGDFPRAEARARESLALRRRVLAPDHPDLAVSLAAVGTALVEAEKPGGEPFLREAIAHLRRVGGEQHYAYTATLNDLSRVVADPAEAVTIAREGVRAAEATYGPDNPQTLANVHGLAIALAKAGAMDQADPLFERVRAGYREVYGDEHVELSDALADWGEALLGAGRAAEAEPLLRAALAMRRRLLPAGHAYLQRSEATLARCLDALGRPRGADSDGAPRL
jgi:serine/threonine protein kinase/tetratricopeptide (TPR) repeat protein